MQLSEGRGDPEVVKTLGASKRSRVSAKLRWGLLLVLVVAGAGFGVTRYMQKRAAERAPHFESKKIERRDIQVVISATGTLQGLNTVEVGAEVSGRITKVYVDYNDVVKKGQVLAEIDPEQLRAVDEATAQLAVAEANIAQARANLLEAEQNAARAEKQSAQGLVAQRDLESAEAARERARATLASSQANATVARATLKSARSRLEKTQILSPIDGVVLSRLMEPGQTVTAGFTTPLLFKLAEDLRLLTLHVYIDEADIGRAQEGQAATFTVDAYPDKIFPSKVLSLRNEPKSDQNVVSYEAVLAVANAERLLRPGMTATATIVSEVKKGVLAVPNAALRFTPPEQPPELIRLPEGERRVWVLEAEKPVARKLKPGVSDGEFTEVRGDSWKEGDPVLVDLVEPSRDRPSH